MERFLLGVLIAPPVFLSLYVFFRKRKLEFSVFELFVLFISIYMVFIPIDHLLGFSIRRHEVFPDLNYDPDNPGITYDIIMVVLCYYLFFVSVCAAYFSLKLFRRAPYTYKATDVIYKRQYLPGARSLILLNACLLTIYIYVDVTLLSGYLDLGSSLKQVRTQVGLHHDPSYRLFSFASNLFVTFNTIIIILAKNRRHTLVALLSVLAMGLFTGDRSTIFIVVIIAVLVHKPVVKRSHSLLIVCLTIVVFVYFKPTYNTIVSAVTGKDSVSFAASYSRINPSLSRIEALSPFEVIRAVLNEAPEEYLYGSTYLATTIKKALPAAIYRSNEKTLAVQFKEKFAPASRGYFGFSPIAEALLNFGYLGLLLIGAVFGAYLFSLRSLSQGIFYYLNVMFIVRFFRADFASLFKRFFVVEAVAMISVMALLTLLYYLYRSRHQFLYRDS